MSHKLKSQEDTNLGMDLDKIIYPKYWFLTIIAFVVISVCLINFWVYNEYKDNKKFIVDEQTEAAAEDFNLILMQMENLLLRISKDYRQNISEIKNTDDWLEILQIKYDIPKRYVNFIDSINTLKIQNSSKLSQVKNKDVIFKNSNLYLVYTTDLYGLDNNKLQIYINLDQLVKSYLANQDQSSVLEFIFRLQQDEGSYDYIFIPGNHMIINAHNDSMSNIEQYWKGDNLIKVKSKSILNNPDWMIHGYLRIKTLQEFVWLLVKISLVVLLVFLLGAHILFKKLYYLEWQRLNITKDKKLFQQRAEITLASISDGVVITNSTDQVVYVNHIVEKLLNKTFIDVYFTTFADLIPELSILSNMNDEQVKLVDVRINFVGYEYFFDVQAVKLYDEYNGFLGTTFFLHDLTQKKQAQKRVRFLAYHDDFTSLPNKLALIEYYKKSVLGNHLCAVGKCKLFTVVLNTPSIKNINDTIGYENGDKTLISLLRVFSDFIKTYEVEGELYRIGSDVLALTCIYDEGKHGKSSNLYITNLINNLVEALSKPLHIDEQDIYMQFYLGVSVYPDNFKSEHGYDSVDSVDPALLLRYAEIAMSAARKKGINRYVFYSNDINISIHEKFILENELRSAIAENKLELLFQPQLELKSNKLRGFETLVRWQKDDGSVVMPGKFIPILEKSGLIVTVGDWIIKEACRLGNSFIKNKIAFDAIAVNVSGLQLQSEEFISRLENIVKASGFPINKLEIEVTESVLLDNPQKVISVLSKIRDLGAKTALDDFGTGFSSLSYLKQLPLDYLKIDKAFVNEINSGDTRLLNAILAISKSLNLITIAEGVETEDQVIFLRQNLCDIIQGYYISRPLSVNDAIKNYS